MRIRNGVTLVAIAAAMTMTTAFAQGPGADTYKSKCQMCHGADGTGSPMMIKAMGVKSFKTPETAKAPDAALIAIIKNGKGKMPSYSGKLTDAQIKDVAAYVHTLAK